MLAQLIISNFAIINHLDILYKPGLNIISGETGAGKSIIINAVNLLLGGRASTDLVRSGADEAKVEALFHVPQNSSVNDVLSGLGFPIKGDLVIKRTISREGRNRVMINGSIATLQMLVNVGLMLMSISGQHEHQRLLKPDNHLFFLDDFGGLREDREALNTAFQAYQTCKEQRDELAREIRKGEETDELARFQREEIEKADIQEGEDSHMEEEKKRLQYAQRLMEIVTGSYQGLYEKEGAVISELSQSLKDLEKGTEADRRLGPIVAMLASAKAELEEAALELRAFKKNIVISPARLEEVEERLHLINRLKRKYGPSLEEVLNFKTRLSSMMGDLGQKKASLKEMDQRIEEMEADLLSRAAELSGKRKRIAKELERAIKGELDLLDMTGTRFDAFFHQEGDDHGETPKERMKTIRADGYDNVEFMLSPNVGEDLKPLSRIASGGELSRIMLALKTILARTASVETIIFDEVDAGIAGATAEVVGEKLQSLAEYHQILCITHLPQIASKGRAHFRVKKRVIGHRTETMMSELDVEQRVREIARLLGGKTVSQQAIAHAKEMLHPQ